MKIEESGTYTIVFGVHFDEFHVHRIVELFLPDFFDIPEGYYIR